MINKLIEELEFLKVPEALVQDVAYNGGLDAAINLIKKQSNWIPASERLPKGPPYKEYLVYRTGDGVNYHAAVDYLVAPETFSEDYAVTHWQPLPPPPSKGEE